MLVDPKGHTDAGRAARPKALQLRHSSGPRLGEGTEPERRAACASRCSRSKGMVARSYGVGVFSAPGGRKLEHRTCLQHASSNPELGYVEFAGWVRGGDHKGWLLAREGSSTSVGAATSAASGSRRSLAT